MFDSKCLRKETGFLIASDQLGVAAPIDLATKATSQYKNIINEILPCVSASRIALHNIR